MVRKQKRHVLLFSIGPIAEDTEALYQALILNQWEVSQVSSFSSAKLQLQALPFNVAIITLSQQLTSELSQQLHDFLSIYSQINWILVLPEQLEDGVELASDIGAIIGQYCFDFHHSPVQLDLFLLGLGHAHGMAEISRNPCKINAIDNAKFGIVGSSEPMQNLFRQIKKICAFDVPVLIYGETGTGKELVANVIHYYSARSREKLVIINCGSLTDSLVQAELFGYEKGAFTGAYNRKIGLIEASDGGTLFLDEVGDLPLSQQANLLRVLQQKTIVRVGGYEDIPVDIRVIAATNVDLEVAVASGKFREDLYYRLKVLHLEVPPLRERGDDIELLCRYYLHNDVSMKNFRAKGLSAEALRVIRTYDWPGNVRELENTIHHAQIMSENNLITPADLDLERRRNRPALDTLEQSRADAEVSAIMGGLRKSKNNISQAAYQLGISRVTLHRLINKYQLEVE
jgi:DNA-binding NtrC family response regulator